MREAFRAWGGMGVHGCEMDKRWVFMGYNYNYESGSGFSVLWWGGMLMPGRVRLPQC